MKGSRQRIALGAAVLALPFVGFGVAGAYGASFCPPEISGCPGHEPNPIPDCSTFPGPVDFSCDRPQAAAPTPDRFYTEHYAVEPGKVVEVLCEGPLGVLPKTDSLINVSPAVPGPYSNVSYVFITDGGRNVGLRVTNFGTGVFTGFISCVDDRT